MCTFLIDLLVLALAVLGVVSGDPILAICGPISAMFYFAALRRHKIVYGKDGIAYDPNTGNTYIHDWAKYFQDPVRRKNLEESLEAIEKIPLGVPLDDNFQPIDRKKK